MEELILGERTSLLCKVYVNIAEERGHAPFERILLACSLGETGSGVLRVCD